MDDEEVVRKVLSKFLKSLKSRIKATDCSEDAIKEYKHHVTPSEKETIVIHRCTHFVPYVRKLITRM